MKQLKTTEKVIGENHFYIRPFPAFTAANISGELAAVLSPLLGGLAALIGADSGEEKEKKPKDFLDTDIEDAVPVLAKSFSGLSGDKFESLMKKLLCDHKNISVESETTGGKLVMMDYDIANEVFCGDVQDMYILCWEVIKINFAGFFKKIGAQFGGLQQVLQKMTPTSPDTDTSMQVSSQS